jgi:hypothetical protein
MTAGSTGRLRDSGPVAALRPRLAAAGVAAVVASAVAACGGGESGDLEAFCTGLQADAQAVMNPQLATDADIEAHLAIYRDLATDAPLAVEEDWVVIVDALEAASDAAPDDAESVELARRAIYSAEQSAGAVRTWVTTNCGFDLATIGPIGTVAAVVPTTTTTTPS